jgi:hypothetical protein
VLVILKFEKELSMMTNASLQSTTSVSPTTDYTTADLEVIIDGFALMHWGF